jgi:hypothetical protein
MGAVRMNEHDPNARASVLADRVRELEGEIANARRETARAIAAELRAYQVNKTGVRFEVLRRWYNDAARFVEYHFLENPKP